MKLAYADHSQERPSVHAKQKRSNSRKAYKQESHATSVMSTNVHGNEARETQRGCRARFTASDELDGGELLSVEA